MTRRAEPPLAAVPVAQQAGVTQTAKVHPLWRCAKPCVWTARMLTALIQGVEGEKWFRLSDKVFAERNLLVEYQQVTVHTPWVGRAGGADRDAFGRKDSPQFIVAAVERTSARQAAAAGEIDRQETGRAAGASQARTETDSGRVVSRHHSAEAAELSRCRDLHPRFDQLWMYCDHPGVEPTNNAAERSLRYAVIWRKRSFGTQSAAGSRLVESMQSVIATCRQQHRNPLDDLTAAVEAAQFHAAPSKLLSGV